MRYLTPLLLSTLLVLPHLPHAQERTATGNLDQQASWTALKNLAEQANGNAKIAKITSDKIVACNNVQKLYAPDNPAKDANGCIAVFEPKNLRIKTNTFQPGGSTCGAGAHTCAVDSKTTQYLCEKFGYAYVTGVSNGQYKSPKNNYIGRWTGTRWQVFNAREDNRPMNSLTCQSIDWQ